jgi:N-acetylglucosamine-6-phosphate deacetylase
VLVSDAVSIAGLPPGRYTLYDGGEVELLASGRLELAGTPLLAGAVTALPTCIANAVRYAGATLSEAIRLVTANPSRLLGLPLAAGRESLRTGVAANLTMYRRSDATGDVEVVRTILGGTVVYEAPGA